MSDKGGKGFTLPNGKGVKSTPLNDAPLKDSSAKSKKARNVQFSSQGSKSDKSAPASSKANSGKGGKGDSGIGGKKEQEPLQLKVENELPKGAKCLMDCEAADILQGIQEQMVILSKDPTIKLPVSFDRGLQYTKKSTHYTDPESVRRVLENLKTYGVTDGEICVIANVYPETADEVFALLPSLKARRIMLDDPVNDVLSELAKLKKSA
ncbi:DNA-directed RNA polymerases IV and V subunit 4-like [Rosa rugosa]|uniref:DNA-directed RNA polymerases IV and V subunit 4-like n=1 Tax=Rosa rugosa TaxID=74645 RepID=UPI002B40B4CA|nr:DNA-directed RNA polymerases IV and V subunit 4-like [Rosa rugosa]XP_062013708.1 DNA-directed RNA polymerases IV and V subunit 4-like [Rosa rugosa]